VIGAQDAKDELQLYIDYLKIPKGLQRKVSSRQKVYFSTALLVLAKPVGESNG
jgi:hypothetical protein